MKQKITLLFLSLFICLPLVKAQKIGLEVQASVNYPLIPDYTRSYYPYKWVPIANVSGVIVVGNSTKILERFRGNPGGRLGMNARFELKKDFYLRAGIGLDFISYRREFSFTGLEEPGTSGFGTITITAPFQKSENIGKTFLLYTDIPVSAGYRFLKKRMSVNLGVTASLLAFSQQYIIDPYHTTNGMYEDLISDNTSMGLKNLSFSVNAELAYEIRPKIPVFVRYSRQLSPIYETEFQYVGNPKYNLFEAGVGYRIY